MPANRRLSLQHIALALLAALVALGGCGGGGGGSGSTSAPPATTTGTYMVTTLAGSGVPGSTNGTGAAASFFAPVGVAVDSAGNVYVADAGNNRIRKVTSGGVVTTLAGSGEHGITDGAGSVASFDGPNGVAVDSAGNVYVADRNNNQIRRVTSGGVVTSLNGNVAGQCGFENGPGLCLFKDDTVTLGSSFWDPEGVAADNAGNVYVADTGNNAIRRIASGGVVTTPAGSGRGPGINGTFYDPAGVAVDSAGNVYVADLGHNRIAKIAPGGEVTTYAGSGVSGFADGAGEAASFSHPNGVAVDSEDNVYVADTGNNRIRKITSGGVVVTIAGTGVAGLADGTGTSASFHIPLGVAVDSSGNVYVADAGNNRIRKLTPQR
jgi:serine/threonine protein kinase, bacterial